MYTCIKFQLIWTNSVFGTKFAQKILQGGVLGQKHLKITYFKQKILKYDWFQMVLDGFR